MTGREEGLRLQNNQRDRLLSRENKAYMTQIICYLRDRDVKDSQIEDIRRDITDMLLEAQERGEKAGSVLGADCRAFCDEILESVEDREEKDQDKKNFGVYLMWLPFIGMACAGINALFYLGKGMAWSLENFFYTLVSLIIWSGLTGIFYIFGKERFYMKLNYFTGKRKIPAVLLAAFFVAAELLYFLF